MGPRMSASKPETVLVTGCAGFIGSAVARALATAGNTVVGIDNVNDAYDPRLKHWRLEQLKATRGFSFQRLDITDRAAVDALVKASKPARILHLAARAGVRQSIQDPWVYLDTNATGTLNVLEACRRNDVPRMLMASTSSLYGAHNPRPFREDADTSKPLSPYAASKKAAEAMAAAYSHLHGIDVAIPRYFTVYGPAGRPDMSMFRFIRWIAEGDPVVVYGDGTQERDFTFVDDIAAGSLAASEKAKGFQVYNLGSDRPVTLLAMIAEIERHLGKKARVVTKPVAQADVPKTWADISKARNELGWEPKTPFSDGVRTAVQWYLANRAWAKDVDLGAV
jgi:UDP-glucuronate 4-epimerase